MIAALFFVHDGISEINDILPANRPIIFYFVFFA
jgi:hypothetical protein